MSHDFPNNIPGLQCQYQLQMEAQFNKWELQATDFYAGACTKNLGWKDFQKCPRTFQTMIQASMVYKSFKIKHSAAYFGTIPARLGSNWLGLVNM